MVSPARKARQPMRGSCGQAIPAQQPEREYPMCLHDTPIPRSRARHYLRRHGPDAAVPRAALTAAFPSRLMVRAVGPPRPQRRERQPVAQGSTSARARGPRTGIDKDALCLTAEVGFRCATFTSSGVNGSYFVRRKWKIREVGWHHEEGVNEDVEEEGGEHVAGIIVRPEADLPAVMLRGSHASFPHLHGA